MCGDVWISHRVFPLAARIKVIDGPITHNSDKQEGRQAYIVDFICMLTENWQSYIDK